MADRTPSLPGFERRSRHGGGTVSEPLQRMALFPRGRDLRRRLVCWLGGLLVGVAPGVTLFWRVIGGIFLRIPSHVESSCGARHGSGLVAQGRLPSGLPVLPVRPCGHVPYVWPFQFG